MRLISSSPMVCKRVLPVLGFGLLGLAFFGQLTRVIQQGHGVDLLLGLVVVSACLYFVWDCYIWSQMDEVCDAGDSLVLRKGGRETQIDLLDISYIDHTSSRPEIVMLRLGSPACLAAPSSLLLTQDFSPGAHPRL